MSSLDPTTIEKTFALAAERYAQLEVNVEYALELLEGIGISLHCWQGDDVGGFEGNTAALGGGLAVTGNYPGKARTADELRADVEMALQLIPGRHRLNLHASYGEFGGRRVDRDAITPEHFQTWIDWAKSQEIKLDFNPTFFSHPKAADGFTLAHVDKGVRAFWIEHGIRCRRIAARMGEQLKTQCVNNFWIPDGFKDTPVDRRAPRERLEESLDAIFALDLSSPYTIEAVEGKLFGLGSESYVVGSHEFYLGYAITRKKMLCLDAGHFHPTESIADKISSVLPYLPGLLLHVSRGVRWDSDHVVILNDDLCAIAREVIDLLPRIHLGLDYFDASINRVAAWVIGTRNLQRALLQALLEPRATLRRMEVEGDFTARLALMEECKSCPAGAVWNYFCLQQGVPPAERWLDQIRIYEKNVLRQRG